MSVRDLIPQNWTQNLPWWRGRNTQPVEATPDPFVSFLREVDRLFDDFFRSFATRSPVLPGISGWPGTNWPSVEITETDKAINISAELPGLEEKDVEVLLEDGLLTLRGEKTSTTEDSARQFSERVYGRFERRIPLPAGIDEVAVEAAFRNGVLTVTLPRTETAQAQVKRIPLKT
ncbi:Hsp20 family protein [Paracoccus kondratievae]|uniref:Hsp20/alpha crystallin family protein n=1 Tax=Paracoccus pantotrophus TaxID=82367 RepID=A0A7H9BYA4_PARPN|nr:MULTISPECIES: Hsp20/alpha crystallin family protein [Paracoccus]QFQ88809.1 Hsp20 family protein [Paracoccus kondratievae]QLH16112.1 Hsp20/alpha crystallin family protein [Paracoccus pantotrophus]UFM65946.1 Hsp20/alpha crystallin family protein [Paracoccus sp. MA]